MRQLKNVTVKAVALVKRPANRKPIHLYKHQGASVADTEAADTSTPSADAGILASQAPDDVLSAIESIPLQKGEDQGAREALMGVAHLLHNSPGLTLQDLLAAGQAAGLDELTKSKSQSKKEDEDEDEDGDDDSYGSDDDEDRAEDDEEDTADGEDEAEDEDTEEEADGKKKAKLKKGGPGSGRYPAGSGSEGKGAKEGSQAHVHALAASGAAALGPDELQDSLRQVAKSDFDESKHPRDSNGRFGSGGAKDPNETAKRYADKARSDKTIDAHTTAANLHYAAGKAADIEASRSQDNSVQQNAYKAAAAAHFKAEEDHRSAVMAIMKDPENDSKERAAANRSSKRAFAQSNIFKSDSTEQGTNMETDVDKLEQVTISKAEHASLVSELQEVKKTLKLQKDVALLKSIKEANQAALGALSCDHDKLASIIKSIKDRDATQADELVAMLTGFNAQVGEAQKAGGSIFKSRALAGGQAPASGFGRFQELVRAEVKKSACTEAEATLKVAATPEGNAAYMQMEGC